MWINFRTKSFLVRLSCCCALTLGLTSALLAQSAGIAPDPLRSGSFVSLRLSAAGMFLSSVGLPSISTRAFAKSRRWNCDFYPVDYPNA